MCFNPRAREGRDIVPDNAATILQVSIHAPAKGATFTCLRPGRRIYRFNPRAREGRDAVPQRRHAGFDGFNPRAREGRDVYVARYGSGIICFNPRAREGRD